MVNNHNIMVKNEKRSILKLLINESENEFTIREISKKRKINYKSAYEAVKKLQGEGAIKLEKKGNTTLCSFVKTLTPSTFLAEKERLNQALRNKSLNVIYHELYKLPVQFIALVFGSYAKKKQKKHSDIDLLIISENAEKIEEKLSLVPEKLHITSISSVEFIEMFQSKKFTVVTEAVKNNIILIGLEDYYRFLENAIPRIDKTGRG